MLKVQHIGIPTSCFSENVEWYINRGYKVIFKTTLDSGVNVAFIDVNRVIFEIYESAKSKVSTPNIGSIVIYTKGLEEVLQTPSGEVLKFINGKDDGLAFIELNTDSYTKSSNYLMKHGFIESNGYLKNGNVKFKLIEKPLDIISCGDINHIAFDSDNLQNNFEKFLDSEIPIVEGLAYLPFFKNGVKYFVTENHNQLRLEYNQILQTV